MNVYINIQIYFFPMYLHQIEDKLTTLYESQDELDEAIGHSRKAGGYFRSAGKMDQYMKSMIKVAHLTSLLNE